MADDAKAYSVTLVQCDEENGAHTMGWLLSESGYEQLMDLLSTGMGEPDVESVASAGQVQDIAEYTKSNAIVTGAGL
jgi:hypothetical protein